MICNYRYMCHIIWCVGCFCVKECSRLKVICKHKNLHILAFNNWLLVIPKLQFEMFASKNVLRCAICRNVSGVNVWLRNYVAPKSI